MRAVRVPGLLVAGLAAALLSASGANAQRWRGDYGYAPPAYGYDAPPPARHARGYDAPPPPPTVYSAEYGRRGYRRPPPRERCDRGTGGTILGAIAGGLLGNGVAGRGDRGLGTVVGAGVGALAGRAIDRDC